MAKSLEDRYLEEISNAVTASLENREAAIRTAIRGIVADVTIAIGGSQREGLRVTALACGYKVTDDGSIEKMTKDLIAAVTKDLLSGQIGE